MNDHRVTTYARAGLTFDVQDGGPHGGIPVILLHGFPQDASSFDHVAPLLHDAGLRTLAPDQRGYSPGASPQDTGAYRADELVADVLALADAAGAESFHLVGHDWGGAVAWLTALRRPERVRTLTVLATPHPSALRDAMRTPDQLRRSWYVGAFQVPRLPELVLSRQMHRFLTSSGLPAEQAARYARRFATPRSLRGPIDWYRAAGRALLGGDDGPQQVQVPTTYVWGNGDVALGPAAARATRRYVDADYRFVEVDASHWLPEVEPRVVADAVVGRVTAARD